MVRPDRSRLLVVALVLASACDSNPRKAERKSTPVPDELDAVDKAPPGRRRRPRWIRAGLRAWAWAARAW
ncbi:MAG: hypothetical protein U0168_23245 [Nannocystaceae bacterium]